MIASYVLAFLTSLILGILISKPIILVCKKLKVSQTILHYVDKHASKSGTATMGGWIFILATIPCLIFVRGDFLQPVLILLTMLSYGFLGFLDDFIKIRFHQNEGLKPYQKIIGQVGIALILAIFVYLNVGTSLNFFGLKLDLSWGIIPFIVVFFVAVTNSVNLTDGLDGLAGGVSATYLTFFGIILSLLSYMNMAIIAFAMVGALFAFLMVNGYPAKIFMGDTGSLALGGLIAALAIFSGLELIVAIIGVLFVLTALSDIIQVAVYKKTKKRVFKMAPLHHHFEKLGVHENRIVTIYIIITLVFGLISALGYLYVVGAI